VKDKPGKLFAKLSFGGYDKKIKDGFNGWLNRDKEEVDKYNADVMCGFVCSNGFYHYFFKGLDAICKSNYDSLDKSFPIFIASGSDDCVGDCGKLVNKLYDRFVSFGLTPKLKLYDGARHEILNEINKAEVYRDFADFANSLI
jgi:alpha-beta hydrolase superfamily lysophospholipase